jgi:hypothetical protein
MTIVNVVVPELPMYGASAVPVTVYATPVHESSIDVIDGVILLVVHVGV